MRNYPCYFRAKIISDRRVSDTLKAMLFANRDKLTNSANDFVTIRNDIIIIMLSD